LLNELGTLTHDDLQDPKYSILHAMGQWVVLLQCACFSSGPPLVDFWSEQAAISEKLQYDLKKTTHAFSKIESQQITETVNTIKNAINRIQTTGGKADECNEISFAIETFEHQLP
ncbi:MAG: hypothetical protein PVI90_16490, partial [Desulfobacteraceae bacterium]